SAPVALALASPVSPTGRAAAQRCAATLTHRRKTMTIKAETATVPENGETVFIPLNKLKKHPKNARKTPHSAESIEQKAASIAAKGILQNLVVEPELDAAGEATGFYLVAIGEGRRQAQ